MTDPLLVALALVVGTLAVARATRLVVHDTWPPIESARDRWIAWSGQHAPRWTLLFTCPFCFAPYAAAVNLAWAMWAQPWADSGAFTGSAADWWWMANLWGAVSYISAMIVVRDEPPEE